MKRTVTLIVILLSGAILQGNRVRDQGSTFRSGVDLVQLDVSVLDAMHRPVRGLTAADFTILENGVRQEVVTFSAVDVPQPSTDDAPWVRSVGSDVAINTFQASRVVVLLLDDLHVAFDPWSDRATRRIARSTIERLAPGDLAAVVYLFNRRRGQEFTTDRSLLFEAVERFSSSALFNGGGACQRYDCVIDAFENAADAVSGLTGQRKVFVFITGQKQAPFKFREEFWSDPSLPANLQRMFDKLRAANVAVYAFDTDGLSSTKPEGDGLYLFADNTGGRAFGGNAPETSVDRLYLESSSYYLLGFAAAPKTSRPGFRRVSVSVNRPGLEVRSRSGYFAGPEVHTRSELPASTADLITAGPLPAPGIPMAIAGAPLRAETKGRGGIMLTTGLDRDVGMGAATISLSATVFSDDWKARASHRQTVRLAAAARYSGLVHFDIVSSFDLPPGRYQVRVGVMEEGNTAAGSAYASVAVPDFSRDPLSLSGVFLELKSPQAVIAKAKPLDGMPVQPTTVRTFAVDDRVTAFIRIYQGGKGSAVEVKTTTRIVDRAGVLVFEEASELPAESFSRSRVADLQRVLPLSRLTPGEYLLTIEARAGTSNEVRQVRFTMK